MQTETPTIEVSDAEIAEAMIANGGGFVSQLGRCYCAADATNKAALREVPKFQEYWDTYREHARAIKANDPFA